MRRLFTILALCAFTSIEMSFAQTVWVNEDFNTGSLPSGWTRSQAAGSDGWEFGSATGLSSPAFTIPAHTGNMAVANDDDCNCNASIDYLISPSVTIPAAGAAVVQFDVFYGELSYQGVTESADLEVSTNGGITWTSVYAIPGDISGWKTYFVDISSYAGQTVNVGFHYDDNGGWLYGIAIDNVQIFEPIGEDASVASLSVPPTFLKNSPLPIGGDILNQGSSTINAIEVFWSDGTTVQKDSITGLNIAPFGSYTFAHSDSLTIATAGNYTLDVWTGAINGLPDLNNANDTISMSLQIVDTLVQRVPLHEVFTSSTCPPCNPGNANLNSIFNPNPNKQIVLKYQMSWPGSGDPYYTLEGGVRRTYYGVSGVPNMFVDGGWDGNTNSYTTLLRDQFYDVPAFMDIESEIRVECQTVLVDVTITPYKDFPGNNVLHMAVIEKLTYNNVKTNGETEFDHVMKKMLPDANGTSIGALVNGVPQTFTFNYTFNGGYSLPANATVPINHSNAHSIEEFWDLDVVAFVQDNTSKEVFQANFSTDMIDYDISLNSVQAISNPMVGTPESIGGEIENWKDSSTLSVQINYSVNNGTPVSETLSTSNFNAKGDKQTFTFTNDWTPSNPGVNTVKIWIDNFNGGGSVDGSNCNDTITLTVNVGTNAGPVADFTFQATGLDVSFTDASTGAMTWDWDFDDGNSSTQQSPNHTYATDGTYNVCLVAGNTSGSDTICKSVSVSTVGLMDESAFSINVQPNPNDGNFQIHKVHSLEGVLTIYDLLGKEVHTQNIERGKTIDIELSGIEKGVYIVNLKSDNGEVSERIVIE